MKTYLLRNTVFHHFAKCLERILYCHANKSEWNSHLLCHLPARLETPVAQGETARGTLKTWWDSMWSGLTTAEVDKGQNRRFPGHSLRGHLNKIALWALPQESLAVSIPLLLVCPAPLESAFHHWLGIPKCSFLQVFQSQRFHAINVSPPSHSLPRLVSPEKHDVSIN